MPFEYGERRQERLGQQQLGQQQAVERGRGNGGLMGGQVAEGLAGAGRLGGMAQQAVANQRGSWTAPESLRGAGMPNPSPGGKHFASELRANIARAEWDDWRNRFLPVFQELRDSVNNPEVMAGAEQRAIDNTNRGFQLGQQATADTQRRYGIQLRPDEREAQDRKFALSKAATQAGLVTNSRRHVRDRDLAVMGGGLGTVAGQRVNEEGY